MRIKLRFVLIAIAVVALLLSIPLYFELALEALQDTTYYAPGYTEGKFRSIRSGMREADVVQVLGKPLKVEKATEYIEWIYGPGNLRVSEDGGLDFSSSSPLNYMIVMADGTGEITFVTGNYLGGNEQLLIGHTLSEMEFHVGEPLRVIRQPSQKHLVYSGTNADGSYFIRMVGIDKAGRVNRIFAGFHQETKTARVRLGLFPLRSLDGH